MYLSEHLFTDNALVVIFNVILRELPGVFLMYSGQHILGKGLLQQHITAVFFVLQDALDALCRPCGVATGCECTRRFQLCLDTLQTVPLQVAVENQPNDFSLLRDDLRLAVRPFSIADDSAVREGEFTVLISHALIAGYILGNRLAFGLGKGAQYGEDHLRVHGGGVDVLFFKYHRDSHLFQHSDVLNTVQCVAGEAGNGFCQYKVDFALLAVLNHLVKTVTLLGMYAGDTAIRVDARDFPLRGGIDFFGVVQLLDFKTALLFFFLGTNTTVGSYPQLAHGIFSSCAFPH